MLDDTNDKDYKRIYDKWSKHQRTSGAQNTATIATQLAGSGLTNSGMDVQTLAARENEELSRCERAVPDIEDADPYAQTLVTNTSQMPHAAMSRLDAYQICSRCQGMGEYKTQLEIGAGCTREITKSCDCDGGIVLKPGHTAPEKQMATEPTKVVQVKPEYQIKMVDAADDDDEEGWIEAEVALPLVQSVQDIDAQIVHMRFLELEVPDLYELRVELPEYVDDEDMECTFDKQTKRVRIRLPVVKLSTWLVLSEWRCSWYFSLQ